MPIKGITDQKTLPRLGKIRTGIKKLSQKGSEYPEEVPYFVLNPTEEVLDKNGNVIGSRENEHINALIKMFGERPLELNVVFPLDDEDTVCGHYLKWWGGNVQKKKAKLLCKGDGEYAVYNGPDRVSGMDADYYPPGKNRICNSLVCPQAQPQGKYGPMCKPNMNLHFLVPEYSLYGTFQLDTTSFQAIQNVVSCIAVARNALRLEGINSIAGVPMRLFRKRTPNSHDGVNYILQLEVDQTALGREKAKFLNREKSTLGLSIESYKIEHQLLDEPNYDLLPKSEFPNHTQTGEIPLIEAEPKAITASAADDWCKEDEIKDLFQKLADSKGIPCTEAKMKATARRFKSSDELCAYLNDQLQPPQDVEVVK